VVVSASSPGGAGQGSADRCHEPGVGVAGDRLTPVRPQATRLRKKVNQAAPSSLVLRREPMAEPVLRDVVQKRVRSVPHQRGGEVPAGSVQAVRELIELDASYTLFTILFGDLHRSHRPRRP
jgi:hypothetical protein